MKVEISVIFSTYNAEKWLEKVLYGFENQNFKKIEIVIADDGSKQPTFDVIQKFKDRNKLQINHVWQEDNGFQKTKILNKAILASKGDYLVFTDGDCIPRHDFLEVHYKKRKEGVFLSGGYYKLPMTISEMIQEKDISSGDCFRLDWLYKQNLKKSIKNLKLNSFGFRANFLNKLTLTTRSWNGHNSSGWKKDLLAVNGFNEEMQYGGEDRELGERLENYGVKGKQIRYSAICVHLDHKRSYVSDEMWKKNNKIREATKKNKAIWTDFGIKKI